MTEFKITAESLEAARKAWKDSLRKPGLDLFALGDAFINALFVPRDEGEGWVEVNNPFGSPDFHKGEYGLRSLMTDWNLYLLQTGTIIKTLTPASTTLTKAQAWADSIIKEREGDCPPCSLCGKPYSLCRYECKPEPAPIAPGSKFRMPDGDELMIVNSQETRRWFYTINLTKYEMSRPDATGAYGYDNLETLHAALLAAGAVRMEEGE